MAEDYTELKLVMEKFVLNSVDINSYESMKILCEKYNKAVSTYRQLVNFKKNAISLQKKKLSALFVFIFYRKSFFRAVRKFCQLKRVFYKFTRF